MTIETSRRRSLFAVIFEVEPNPARYDEYLQIAGALRQDLLEMRGFLENERFRSQSRPGALLSLSLWDDEKALVRWRATGRHHEAQAKGRAGVLSGYHLRVGEVTTVGGCFAAGREVGWIRQDETETATEKALTLIDGVTAPGSPLAALVEETTSGRDGAACWELFEHLADRNRVALLQAWRTGTEADVFARAALERCGQDANVGPNVYAIRIVRDYGMTDRGEAPQYHR